jgi:hypothetical protein
MKFLAAQVKTEMKLGEKEKAVPKNGTAAII